MEDNKKCTTIWLRPSVIRRMDAWMEEANCRSRSEFIEKAVRFYMGYLGTEDTSEYLSDALVATLRGIIADSTNRTNGILFKCAVERVCGGRGKAHQWSDQVRGCPGCPTAAAG